MALQLRDAVAGDAAQIAEVYLASRHVLLPFAPLAHTEEEVRRWVADVLVPGGGMTVAVERQAVVGFVAVSAADGVGWIDQLYVAPGRVGQGCGSRLLEHALEGLPRPVRLYTFQANLRARRFYEARGFMVVSEGDGTDNEERCPDLLLELRAAPSPKLHPTGPAFRRGVFCLAPLAGQRPDGAGRMAAPVVRPGGTAPGGS